MADKGGTLETIVTALARIFEPLFVGMQEGEVRRLLAELGYPLTEPQAAAIRPTTQDVANKLDDLFAITNELTVASENDDTEGIVQKGTEAVAKLAHVVSSLIDLKNALDGLGLTGTTA